MDRSNRTALALEISRMYLKRERRELRDNAAIAVVLILPVLVATVSVVGYVPIDGYEQIQNTAGAYVLGTNFARGEQATIVDTAGGFAGVLFLLSMYMTIIDDVKGSDLLPEHYEHYLLSSGSTTVAIAEYLSRVGFVSMIGLPVLLFGSLAFGIGSTAPMTVVSLLLAGAALILTSAALGQTLSHVVLHVLNDAAIGNGARKLIGGSLVLAATGVLLLFRRTAALLNETVLSGYADLGFAITGAPISQFNLIVVCVLLPISIVTNILILSQIGPQLWVGNRSEEPSESAGRRSERLERVLSEWVSPPVASTVVLSWRRVSRTPESLLYALTLVPIIAGVIVSTVAGTPEMVPGIIAIYGSIIFSVCVTANPFGNENGTLPLYLTAPAGGRKLLLGYGISAMVPAVLVVVPVTVAVGTYLEVSSVVLLYCALIGVVLAVCTPVISLGVGMAMPNVRGGNTSANSGLQPPRFQAVLVLSVLVTLIAQPAMFGVYNSQWASSLVGLSAWREFVGIGLIATTIVASVVTTTWSYRYASAKIETRA